MLNRSPRSGRQTAGQIVFTASSDFSRPLHGLAHFLRESQLKCWATLDRPLRGLRDNHLMNNAGSQLLDLSGDLLFVVLYET